MSRLASFDEIIGSYLSLRSRYVAKLPRRSVVNRLIHDVTRGWSMFAKPSKLELFVALGERTASARYSVVAPRVTLANAVAGFACTSLCAMPKAETAANVAIVTVSIFLWPSARMIDAILIRQLQGQSGAA